MVWQKVLELRGDTIALVQSKAGKTYNVTIWDDVDTDEIERSLEAGEEVWGNVSFNNEYGTRKNVALLEEVKIGKW